MNCFETTILCSMVGQKAPQEVRSAWW